MKSLWKDVKPFYKLLHTVVRHYLSKIYSDIDEGPIPAHLLGEFEMIFYTIGFIS